MAWSDTDDGGYGEFGGGYACALGGEGMRARDVEDLQREVWNSVWAGRGKRTAYGLHPNQLDEYGRGRGFLSALQNELAKINQNVRNNNTLDAIWAHNDNLRNNVATDQLFTEHTDPITYHGLHDRSRIGTMDARHYPTVIGGYPQPAGQSGPYPMGGIPMGPQSGGWPGPSGSYNTGATQNSDAGWAEGGGEPYIRPRRLAYRNAYDQWDEQGGFGGGM